MKSFCTATSIFVFYFSVLIISKTSAVELPCLLDPTVSLSVPPTTRPLYECMTSPTAQKSNSPSSTVVKSNPIPDSSTRSAVTQHPSPGSGRPSAMAGAPPQVPSRSSKPRLNSLSIGASQNSTTGTAPLPPVSESSPSSSPAHPTSKLSPSVNSSGSDSRAAAPAKLASSSSLSPSVHGKSEKDTVSPSSSSRNTPHYHNSVTASSSIFPSESSPQPSPASSQSIACKGEEAPNGDRLSPSLSLSYSILRRPHIASPLRPCSRTSRVSFDEESIRVTRTEMQMLRGVHGCIDDEAIENKLYLSNTTREQAADKLRGAPLGSFIVVDSDNTDSLVLCHVHDGKVQQKKLQFKNPGIAVKDSPLTFECLSDLLHHYANPSADSPFLLQITDSYPAVKSHNDDHDDIDDDDGDGDSTGNEQEQREHMEMESPRSKRSSLSHPYVMFEPLGGQPWFQSGLTRASANALIEFEPTGTFVVWDDPDNPGVYVLSYVKNGRLLHTNVEPNEDGFAVDGSKRFFKDMRELIHFYCSEEAVSAELGCRLRAPRSETVAAPPTPSRGSSVHGNSKQPLTGSSHQQQQDQHNHNSHGYARAMGTPPIDRKVSPSPQRKTRRESTRSTNSTQSMDPNQPLWLQLNLPKAQALAPIAGLGDGAFVIRSSESRPDCMVLSYKFKGQIIYELIRKYSGRTVQYGLECAPDRRFITLNELVKYYELPRPELKYPLSVGSMGVYGTASFDSDGRLDREGSRHSTRSAVSISSTASSPGLPRKASRQQLIKESGGGQMMQRDGSRAKLTRSESRQDITRSDSVRSDQSAGSRRSPRGAMLKKQASGVTVIRTNGERLDQRAAMSSWFCMNLDKEEVIQRIPKERQGAFLVRRASDSGFCTISYACKGKIEHALVEDTPSGLHIVKSHVR